MIRRKLTLEQRIARLERIAYNEGFFDFAKRLLKVGYINGSTAADSKALADNLNSEFFNYKLKLRQGVAIASVYDVLNDSLKHQAKEVKLFGVDVAFIHEKNKFIIYKVRDSLDDNTKYTIEVFHNSTHKETIKGVTFGKVAKNILDSVCAKFGDLGVKIKKEDIQNYIIDDVSYAYDVGDDILKPDLKKLLSKASSHEDSASQKGDSSKLNKINDENYPYNNNAIPVHYVELVGRYASSGSLNENDSEFSEDIEQAILDDFLDAYNKTERLELSEEARKKLHNIIVKIKRNIEKDISLLNSCIKRSGDLATRRDRFYNNAAFPWVKDKKSAYYRNDRLYKPITDAFNNAN